MGRWTFFSIEYKGRGEKATEDNGHENYKEKKVGKATVTEKKTHGETRRGFNVKRTLTKRSVSSYDLTLCKNMDW